MRKLFLDFGYNKVIKCANVFYIIFYSFIACLEIYFMIDNFSVELIAKYGPPVVVLIYVSMLKKQISNYILILYYQILVTMIFTIILEKKLLEIVEDMDTLFWSIDSAGRETRSFILTKSKRTNLWFYVHCATILVVCFTMCPFCGTHDEWSLAENTFYEYLKPCSKIFYHLHYWSMFFLVFSSFRLCSTIFYDAAVIHSQIILINRRILQVCGDNPGFDKLNIEERIHYQNEIFKTLCCCIEHHVAVTRLGGDKC
jgi:hypothetical protein